MWIGHPIPELQLFWKFDFENQRSRSWVGSSSKSQCGSNILSIHIPFVPCQSALPFLRYSIFRIWPWKSRVKVMGEVTVRSHNVGLTSYWLRSLSFHVKRPSQSWVTTFFLNLTLIIKGQGHGWGHSSKSQCGSNILSIHIPFVPCQSALPFQRYSIFKIWPWKSRVKVKWPWRCTTTGLDNSIELRMVQIHPGVSEIWVPQSLAQVLPDLTSFWPMGKPIWGKWVNNYDSAQLQVQTSPWNFKWGQSIQRFQRYAFRKVWTQFVPNLTSFWAMGKPIWGKWANDHDGAQLQA